MTALILLAHGSRHPETKPVLEDVVALVREKMPLTRLGCALSDSPRLAGPRRALARCRMC